MKPYETEGCFAQMEMPAIVSDWNPFRSYVSSLKWKSMGCTNIWTFIIIEFYWNRILPTTMADLR